MTASLPESHADLLDNPNVAALSTVGADGYPQVTAIWFVRDGDRILTSLTTERQKHENADTDLCVFRHRYWFANG